MRSHPTSLPFFQHNPNPKGRDTRRAMPAAAAATTAGRRLRGLLAHHLGSTRTSLALPGAFNGLVARAVAQEGFQAAYVSGAGVAAGMGLPDIGLAGLEDSCRVIRCVCVGGGKGSFRRKRFDSHWTFPPSACAPPLVTISIRTHRDVAVCSGVPVLSDADTGFTEGTEGISRVVYEYSRAGAAGLHLEDQVFPKRCGHLDGKQLVSPPEFATKVQAAARARDALGNGFVVCARTDARGVEGLEAAVDRAKRYVDAGADMVFPEGLASLEEFEAVAKALRGYNGANGGEGPFLLANMTEFGKTPLLSTHDFGRAGVHATIFPMTLFRFAMRGVVDGLRELKEHGRVLDGELHGPLEGRMLTREETYELMGYTPSHAWPYPSPNHTGREAEAQEGAAGGPRRRTSFRQKEGKKGGE